MWIEDASKDFGGDLGTIPGFRGLGGVLNMTLEHFLGGSLSDEKNALALLLILRDANDCLNGLPV